MAKTPTITSVPDRAELTIEGYQRLMGNYLGVDFEAKVFDAGRRPVEGWRLRIRSSANELVDAVTDAAGSYRGRRVVLVQQGIEERFILLLDNSSVGDWKTLQEERTWTDLEKKKELEEIKKGNGGIVKAGEKLTFNSGEYIIKGWIEIEEGAEFTIEPGCTLQFEPQKGIRCKGRLMAVGTLEKPISFSCAKFNDAERKDPIHWGNISLIGKGVRGSKLSHCQIKHGESFDYGGGIALLGAEDVEISNVLLQENRAQYGGGIGLNESMNIKIEKAAISGNRASQGGGVYIRGGIVELLDFKAEKNSAQFGGGVYMASGYELQGNSLVPIKGGSIELDIGVIKNNISESGGGIYVMSGIDTDQRAKKRFGVKRCQIIENKKGGVFILFICLAEGPIAKGKSQGIQMFQCKVSDNSATHFQICGNTYTYYSKAVLPEVEMTFPLNSYHSTNSGLFDCSKVLII